MAVILRNDAGEPVDHYPECFGTYVSDWSDDCPEAPLCWYAERCEKVCMENIRLKESA